MTGDGPNFDSILRTTLLHYQQSLQDSITHCDSIVAFLSPPTLPLRKREMVRRWLRTRRERVRDAWGVLNGNYPEGDD